MWDDKFELLLRGFLPFIGADEPLAEDATLRDLGLDSLGTVELLAALETEYEVRFYDDALGKETFQTPSLLWKVLSGLVAERVG
ncbi:phosphopantetheine-binding protein [Streptomyces sp. NPDC049906]|uniref:phosphopantetheine-binding protein n=1 Tax=Streptomyces sp. NPDC049906 TaxID=3155656 RepID=UPI003416F2D2